jgi:hypothetical protein
LKMTRARFDGLLLLLFGSLLFVLSGIFVGYASPFRMSDFKEIYYGARCAIQHHDPYRESELWNVYQAETVGLPSSPSDVHSLRLIVGLNTNVPTTLILVAPLAMLPWKLAAMLWTVLLAGCFVIGSFLAWTMGAEFAPRISGGLIFLLVANSQLILFTGNSAGLVIGLSVIAVWCFFRDRLVVLGVICLAIALVIKPHDAGPIWLYFLLAGGSHRRRALQTLTLTLVLAVPAILWIAHVSPHWIQELHSNLSISMQQGGRDDPGPASGNGRGMGMIVDLRTIVSLLRDDPRVYNPVAFLACGVPILIWSVNALVSRFRPETAWFGLATIAALGLLPFYHRSNDARILLLAVPAGALLWSEGGPIRKYALPLTVATVLSTADSLWIVLVGIVRISSRTFNRGSASVPLLLLSLGIFYLWIYVGRSRAPSTAKNMSDQHQGHSEPLGPR